MNTTMSTTMSTVHDEIVERPGERGYALLGTLLMLMMMSAMAAALGVNGQTETLISRNQRSATQATVAAEAGLNHAIALVSTFIKESGPNGFNDIFQATNALLLGPDLASGTVETDADNGSLGTRAGIDAAEAIPIGTQLTIAAGVNATYEAFIRDDDATAPDEPGGDLYDDENEKLIVRATGYGPDDTKVVLEALIGPTEIPGVFVNGDLTVSGSVDIQGTEGHLHTNGDLVITGGGSSIAGTVTASGSYSGSHAGSSGATPLPVIEVSASDYLADADYILTSNGQVTEPNGTVVCDASSDSGACKDSWGWDYKGDATWESYEDGADSNTFYVEGDVIRGSSGSDSDPLQLTISAEGSINVNGNPHISPDTPLLQFVTDGDLEISGTPEMHAMGQILVHEQIKLNGNSVIIGPISVENAANDHDLVEDNEISGNPTITYNGGIFGAVVLIGWWDVRDAT